MSDARFVCIKLISEDRIKDLKLSESKIKNEIEKNVKPTVTP